LLGGVGVPINREKAVGRGETKPRLINLPTASGWWGASYAAHGTQQG
jgi:hypothetical protein